MHRMPFGSLSGSGSLRWWLPALAVALALTAPAAADVVVKQKTVSLGLGGFGAGTTDATLTIAGDKSRSEDEFTYTGRFKTLVGKKPQTTVSITRLDREVMWHLDLEKQQYTELTFAEMRAATEAGMGEMEKSAREEKPKDADMTFTVDVKKTGARQEINGFPCEQVIVTCIGKPAHPKKGEEGGEIHLVTDEWLSTKVPGQAEIEAFHRKFAEKMGLDMTLMRSGGTAQRMYGNGMREMAAKLKDLQGYPVKTTFTVEGPPTPPGQQASAEGQKEQAEAKKGSEEPSKEEPADLTSGGSITGKLGGFFGKKLGKAASKKAEEKAAAPGDQSAGGALFKVVTEVVSISSAPAPAGSFDVPAGYKKVERK